ncbi:MAG: DUF975 family protein [Lachnospiraceae bacterium]|nr:DUF975 family protein [Lachnospiraceae bacterium]
MWNRAELKSKAKDLLAKNYWKMLLVALILSLITGTGSSSGRDDTDTGVSIITDAKDSFNEIKYFINDPAEAISSNFDGIFNGTDAAENDNHIAELFSGKVLPWYTKYGFVFNTFLALSIVFAILLSLCIGLLLAFFLVYPLKVSCRRFFLINYDTDSKAEPKEMGYVWRSNNTKNVGITMFMNDIIIFLWSLLLIVPGIMKAYSYRMVPYILAENPDMNWREVLKTSEEMMMGHRFDTFVLDLSFIGWFILSALTLEVLSIFYVNPYYQQTCANLYRALSPKKKFYEDDNTIVFSENDFEKREY